MPMRAALAEGRAITLADIRAAAGLIRHHERDRARRVPLRGGFAAEGARREGQDKEKRCVGRLGAFVSGSILCHRDSPRIVLSVVRPASIRRYIDLTG